jgi:hypothetical protein
MINFLKKKNFFLVYLFFLSGCASTIAMANLGSDIDVLENECYSEAVLSEGFYSHNLAYDDNQEDVIKKIPPEKYVAINEKTAVCMKNGFQTSGYDFGNVALAYQKQFDDRITIGKDLISKKITLQEAAKLLAQKQQEFDDYLISTDDFLHVTNGIKHQQQMEYYQSQAELEQQQAAAWAALSPEERMAYIQAEALKDQANAIRESATINSNAMQKSAQMDAYAVRRAQLEANKMRNQLAIQKETVTNCSSDGFGGMRCTTR